MIRLFEQRKGLSDQFIKNFLLFLIEIYLTNMYLKHGRFLTKFNFGERDIIS